MEHIVFLHGYGANADDLKPLETYLKTSEEQVFHFPEAPLSLYELTGMPQARAWFDIDPQRLMMAQASGVGIDLSMENPPNLDEAIDFLSTWIQKNLPSNPRLILGGFSQGAMCSYHFYNKFSQYIEFSKLVILSGNLLARNTLVNESKGNSVPVFQSHGHSDSVLPFAGALQLQSYFQECEHSIEFHGFDGGHEIPLDILEKLKSFLSAKM